MNKNKINFNYDFKEKKTLDQILSRFHLNLNPKFKGKKIFLKQL